MCGCDQPRDRRGGLWQWRRRIFDGRGSRCCLPEEEAAIVDASAEVLVARWGGEGAFFVVLRANDLGYRTQQIVDAADTIAADGTIQGVAPEGEPLGMLTELPDTEQQSLRWTAAPVTEPEPTETARDAYIGFIKKSMDEAHNAAKEAIARAEAKEFDDAQLEMEIIIVVQKLGMQGYSAPQIIEAIFFRDDRAILEDFGMDSNCRIAVRSGNGWLQPAFPPAENLGCIPVWETDSAPAESNVEAAEDDNAATQQASTEGEEVGEATTGSFSGPVDFGGYFELVEHVGDVATATGEMVVVIDGDQVTSITGTGTVYWPELEVGNDVTICSSDTTWTLSAEVPIGLGVDGGFTAPGLLSNVGTSTCSGKPSSDAIDDNDPVTIVGTPTGGGSQIDIRIDFEGAPIGLTALLTRS